MDAMEMLVSTLAARSGPPGPQKPLSVLAAEPILLIHPGDVIQPPNFRGSPHNRQQRAQNSDTNKKAP